MRSFNRSGRRATAHVAIAMATLVLSAGAAAAAEIQVGAGARTDLSLTVYNQDLALIAERRRVALDPGESTLALEDVSAALRPETVLLRGAGVRLIEQSFAYDLITPQRLLQAAVGEDVRVIRIHPQTGEEIVVDAHLLGISEGVVLRIGDRIETRAPGRIVLDGLPADVRERPTLLATVDSATGGETDLELSYLSGGLSWHADYVAELNEAEDRLSLTGLVTLNNTSGTAFAEATLRLVAGDVNVARKVMHPAEMRGLAMAEQAAAPAPQAAGELYVYRLDRPVTLANNATKQVALLDATEVAVRKVFRLETWAGMESRHRDDAPRNAQVIMKLDNSAASGLGQPLPAGVIRVYQAAPGGRLFAGEDEIRHTATGEKIDLAIGAAFDVTGEAAQTAFERISNRSYETAEKVTLRNAKDVPVDVEVLAHLPLGWRLVQESAGHTEETANRVTWTIPVPAQGSADLTYRIRVNQ